MDMLRILKDGEWLPIYFKELKNRLRRDKNLADVNSVSEARKNLGLTGEVDSHVHDDRYIKKSDYDIDIANHKKVLEDEIQALSLRFDNLYKTANNALTEINSSVSKDMLVVSSSKPSGAQGKVWINTTENKISLNVYDGGKWKTVGAVWMP
jgi:hypothetical protein